MIEQYLAYKRTEQFLNSLMIAKPLPHFAPSAPDGGSKIPFGLDRIRDFLDASGNPHLKNRYVHIAGTSGKTSTTYFAAHLFQAQGLRCGMFTSPHLSTFAEYFLINQRPPSMDELIRLVNEFIPLLDSEYERTGGDWLSHFECVLALALIYFGRQRTDVVMLEAGLGGRHDATNVLPHTEVSILTNIGLDHTNILGDTVQEIAAEKIGILKPGTPLITAEQRPELLDFFRREARKFAAAVEALGQDFRVERVRAEAEQTIFDYVSDCAAYRELATTMRGGYQAANAALALRALEIFAHKHGLPVNEDELRAGLMTTTAPCRFEQVHDDPPVILDGAHNPDKISQLTTYLAQWSPRNAIIFVCGFTAGKNPQDMLASLLQVSARLYLTRVITDYRASEDPLRLKSIAQSVDPSADVTISLDPYTALERAMKEARATGKMVCVTGSLYLAGCLRQRWVPEHRLLNGN